jgi:tRNA modification GTPase
VRETIPDSEDTIVAPSTAPGQGAIAVVRLSGPRCLDVADRVFRGPDLPSRLTPRKLHLGEVVDPQCGEVVDQVFLATFHAPRSYTTQNMVEISCHGGQAVVRAILSAVLAAGARMAHPGEFTLRAFLGGRIDLAQAEAVSMLVRARSEAQRKVAYRQLKGALSRSLREAHSRLLNLLAELEASIDFPGDDLDAQQSEDRILRGTQRVSAQLDQLLSGASAAKLVAEGARVAVIGKPNVGKSTLLNILCGQERAIVTDEPGTTRDTIEVTLEMVGLLVTLIDTAGLGLAAGTADREGQQRSSQEIDGADLCLVVLDASVALDDRDDAVIAAARGRRTVYVKNKCDLPMVWSETPVRQGQDQLVTVSCLTGVGIDRLRKITTDVVSSLAGNGDSLLVVSARHRRALERAAQCLRRAQDRASESWWLEVVAEELREARAALGAVTGQEVEDELLREIFSRFCIGK